MPDKNKGKKLSIGEIIFMGLAGIVTGLIIVVPFADITYSIVKCIEAGKLSNVPWAGLLGLVAYAVVSTIDMTKTYFTDKSVILNCIVYPIWVISICSTVSLLWSKNYLSFAISLVIAVIFTILNFSMYNAYKEFNKKPEDRKKSNKKSGEERLEVKKGK